ncbi:hypothetical protein BH20ACI2_BH20ACI2_07990 [soil metagenome]
MAVMSSMLCSKVMRTTLTIDDDVVYGLKKLQENERDKSFKEIVNETLRKGLRGGSVSRPKEKRFVIKPFDLGLREGLSYDNIEELLDIVEGPRQMILPR